MRTMVVALLLIAPSAGAAQPQSPVARADFAVTTGAFAKRQPEVPDYDRFANSILGDLSGGFYWTDHVKTEISVAWTSEASRYGREVLPGPGNRTLYFENKYRNVVASAAQSYQFGRNAFFHPFLTVGIDVDRERHTRDRPAQTMFSSGPPAQTIIIPASINTETRTEPRPFAGAGFKGYLSRKGFFRTDLKFGFAGGVDQVTWRVGFGADF
jgi:hypothetical protein